MKPNDVIAQYAIERLQLMVQLEQADQRIRKLEEKLKASEEQSQ